MANRYANLVGSQKISQEYTKINDGFDQVEVEMDAEVQARTELETRVDNILNEPDPNKDLELVDIRTPAAEYTPEDTIEVAGDMTRDMQKQFVSHVANNILKFAEIEQEISDISNEIEALFDTLYEQGDYYPVLIGSSVPGSNTYTTQRGRYTRIGNQITIYFDLHLSAKDENMAGSVQITGAPYVSTINPPPAGSISRYNNIALGANYSQLSLYGTANGALIYKNGDDISSTTITASGIGDTTRLVGSMSYVASGYRAGFTPMHFRGEVDDETFGRDLDIDGNYAYVTDLNNDAVYVIDISDLGNPKKISTITSDQIKEPRGVKVQGNYLYIANRGNGAIVAVNVSDPENPVQASYYQNVNLKGARGLWIDGNNLYAAIGHFEEETIENEAMAVFDISNPNDISQIVYHEVDAGCGNVEVVDDIAYLVAYRGDDFALYALDVSDLQDITQLDKFVSNNLESARGIQIDQVNDIAYMCSADGGVMAVDISDPEDMTEISYVTGNLGGARQAVLWDNYLYVACRSSGTVVAVDVSDPANMGVCHIYNTAKTNGAYGIERSGDNLFVASTNGNCLTILSR